MKENFSSWDEFKTEIASLEDVGNDYVTEV